MTSRRERNKVAEWFREIHRPLRRFIAGRSDVPSADIDDVAQEVFLRLLRYERSDLVTDARGYLFKIAANVASEWAMRARRRWPHDSSWLDELTHESAALDELERWQQGAQIQRALNTLPARAREILRLHYGEDLTEEAIAVELGITPRMVKRDKLIAYARLRLVLTGGHEEGREAVDAVEPSPLRVPP
jgi:RNA polymerase sigma factor (sigma-70 family)